MVRRLFKSDLASHIVLMILALISLYPFIFMIFTSLKDNGQFYSNYFGLSFPLHLGNYASAWHAISKYIFNSIFYALASVVIIIVTSSLAGYSFARLRYRMKGFLYVAVLALMMIPGELTLIPLFLEIKAFHLMNSYLGLVLVFAAGGQAFTIFVLRQAFASLPEELFESARIDGCTEVKAYFRIALPLVKSMIGTMAIWNVLSVWNAFMLPLVILNDSSKFPITVGLLQFQSQFSSMTLYGPMFAGYTIATLPLLILFLFTMKLFIQGLTSSAIKM